MSTESLDKQISNQVKNFRKEQGLTQEGLAEKAGMDFSYIGRIERNKVNYSLNTINKIIVALGVTPAEFFEFLKLDEQESEIYQLLTKVNGSKKRDVLLNMIREMIELSEE
ncbi:MULTISPECIES: helix-turn-helix domain-containing protein [Tetragenococcus]|uniref:HTH cro/C1-type domain-containing protein n=3 Tax=Tetragenococcus TaxID=51668 RepID=A0A091BZ22_9ENTE|nr:MULTISPECIES: helix-turn-helix transcriptional regulator [Tetragenococcus]GMA53686.1 hypothetical protein GCM10025857_50430 [Alicyclobacillus contaminans]AYW47968.1 XRE family transcriptional regulator [Tetragenococcus osmophilus]KFN89720.1 hypothetical protein TMU3MR103_1843 [Tetragenococcus muriaticus 3MR10-3]KFN90000.1 hypothetical protein TMUPMC115_2135 [Tetragenococcus muriaticus PMC-11-5]GMA72383.1 hypothetical protein GCM10025885_14320 [Tetragenococcus osmophilus]